MIDRLADIVVYGATELGLTDNPIPVASLLGEHDLATRDDLHCVLEPLADEGGALIIDVSRATFIDRSILDMLVSIDRRANRHGRPRPIIQIDPATVAWRIFQITRCDEQLVCAFNRNEANKLADRQQPSQAPPLLEQGLSSATNRMLVPPAST